MRHLRSIFYALVLAPSIWVLSGVGFTHDLSSRGRELFAAESISGLLLLIFAGILYAILAFAPVSPAGPVLAGAAYLGVTIWAWQSPAAYAALWAPEVSKEGFDLSRPGYGLAALLAVPLLGTALSARRWARYEPPVLPIIGEIGRFRGAAKVAGIPVSIAETTVIRVGTPADRTEVVTATDSTAAVTATDSTAAVTATDRTVIMPAVPASAPSARPATSAPAPAAGPATPVAASDPTVAIRLPEAEPTTVLATPSEKPAVASGSPATAEKNDPAVVEKNEPAEAEKGEPAEAEKDEATFVLQRPADDRTQPLSVAQTSRPETEADATRPLVLPAAEADDATLPHGLAINAGRSEENGDEPTRPHGLTVNTGKNETNDDELTRPHGLVTPPGDVTEPLRLPTEPTALIPAQRQPPEIES
ncbi:hypothetical protein [Actinoplanes campanulatus]|uniref:hypothetical protein n=1 Tax=Actinoplanes campanulatus TaxID=113559 RepID=UPI001605ED45|nr:hypothetical protein [Actinoplanes campanulatus]GGN28034.1 hypothetical protein GCM10010109_46090 [Actinoplanes campanulatus]GID37898.1 hypothetical protein Aca09nite_44040 [Actinoplanes campanulatus]